MKDLFYVQGNGYLRLSSVSLSILNTEKTWERGDFLTCRLPCVDAVNFYE